PGADTLAPPVLTELIEKIIDNRVESEFTKETMNDLENSQVFAFILKNNILFVHTKIYNYLMQKYKVSPRKMRQYFEHYLLDDASKQMRIQAYRARFWRMDWNKILTDFPELEQVKVIEIKEAQIIQEDDEINLKLIEQLLESTNIEKLRNGIEMLYKKVQKENKIIDNDLKGDIEAILKSDENDIDNDEYLREVLGKIFNYFKEAKT
ncbi:MAG: hypothetical protein ACP5L4_07180, partial [Thermoplasmata archaeon]